MGLKFFSFIISDFDTSICNNFFFTVNFILRFTVLFTVDVGILLGFLTIPHINAVLKLLLPIKCVFLPL